MNSSPVASSSNPPACPRVLVLYYSFSGQTISLINRLTAGLVEEQIEVMAEKIKPMSQLRFPIGSLFKTIVMMITTSFRSRVPIQELSAESRKPYDLVLLAGPTWSYNPSGPILALLDRDGKELFLGKTVIPIISCRGYWRLHWFGLRSILHRCGATLPNVIVFSHPHSEPWRTLGLLLKLMGKNPENARIIGRHYRRYGHSLEQLEEARRFGRMIGAALNQRQPLKDLDFKNALALP